MFGRCAEVDKGKQIWSLHMLVLKYHSETLLYVCKIKT
jgi:hypothetical protein